MIEDINKKINVVKNQVAEKKVMEEKLKDLNQNIVMNEYELKVFFQIPKFILIHYYILI